MSQQGRVVTVFTNELINATATVTGDPIPVHHGATKFTAWGYLTAGTAPDVQVEYQASYDDTAGNFLEMDNETGMSSANPLIDLAGVDKAVNGIFLVANFIRFLLVGQADNSADTTVTLVIQFNS